MEDIKEEIWKPVPGFEGIYDVSSLGRVKSLYRVIQHSHSGIQTFKERILKTSFNAKGYKVVSFTLKCKRTTTTIHQLVAEVFLNHKRCGMELTINHINGIKTDNNVNNLEIVTNRYNASDAFKRCYKNKSSKYTGVMWFKRDSNWCARIYINKTKINLGYFETEELAHNIYQNALLNLHKFNGDRGEFRNYIKSITNV